MKDQSEPSADGLRINMRLRVPAQLHAELKAGAERAGVPLGSFAAGCLAIGMGRVHKGDLGDYGGIATEKIEAFREHYDNTEMSESIERAELVEPELRPDEPKFQPPTTKTHHRHRFTEFVKESKPRLGIRYGIYRCECGQQKEEKIK